MNKVVITMVTIIIILSGIILATTIYKNQQQNNTTDYKTTKLSDTYQNEEIYDDCTDEGELLAQNDNQTVNDVITVNNTYGDTDKTEFVLRDENGLITIYKIENNKEIEYDSTDISTSYLPEEDKENLKNGITVYGKKNLNQILENFE